MTHHHILWLIQCQQLLCVQLHSHPFLSSLQFYFLFIQLCVILHVRDPHRYYKTPPLMNRRAPDRRAAVLFILSWLAGSFNGNLNKLLNATMKLHLCIQCQCKDPPRIPVNSQVQPASLSFLVLRFSCSLSYRWGIDRRGCRALEIISNRPGSHLLCPPAQNHRPLRKQSPYRTVDRFKVQPCSVVQVSVWNAVTTAALQCV